MLKRFICFNLFLALCFFIAFENKTQNMNPASAGQDKKPEQTVFTLQFYHCDEKYNQEMVDAFRNKYKDIDVQLIPLDLKDSEKNIKIGIAAGNPADIAYARGDMISDFSNIKMAEDLTPYLDTDSEWKNSFIQDYLDTCHVNGKYYAIPYQPEIETIYFNKDLFKKYKIEVPQTWDDFLNVCSILKSKGIFGIGVKRDEQYQLLEPAYQIMAQQGDIAEITSGKIPFAGPEEATGLRKALELIQRVYKNGYVYPGANAPVTSGDEVKYAFYHGKIGMLMDSGSQLMQYNNKSDFEVGIMQFPKVDSDSRSTVYMKTDALFVPHTARHKKEAVQFIKFYTSVEGQKILMKSWRPPVLKSTRSDIAQVRELQATIRLEDAVMYKPLQQISPGIKNYIINDMILDACTRTSIDDSLSRLEALRQPKN